MIDRIRGWLARERERPPRFDPTDPALLARIRRQLDAEALRLYQTERGDHWVTPTYRWPDWEEAAVAIAQELAQFGVRSVKYLRTETQEVCDHPSYEPHRSWCREPTECYVFQVSKRRGLL